MQPELPRTRRGSHPRPRDIGEQPRKPRDNCQRQIRKQKTRQKKGDNSRGLRVLLLRSAARKSDFGLPLRRERGTAASSPSRASNHSRDGASSRSVAADHKEIAIRLCCAQSQTALGFRVEVEETARNQSSCHQLDHVGHQHLSSHPHPFARKNMMICQTKKKYYSSLQVALCKLLCVSCSAQVALGKALCANWSVQVGLRKLL